MLPRRDAITAVLMDCSIESEDIAKLAATKQNLQGHEGVEPSYMWIYLFPCMPSNSCICLHDCLVRSGVAILVELHVDKGEAGKAAARGFACSDIYCTTHTKFILPPFDTASRT